VAVLGTPLLGAVQSEQGLKYVRGHDRKRDNNKASRDEKVLIVISAGADNASRHDTTEILAMAERSEAIIYGRSLR